MLPRRHSIFLVLLPGLRRRAAGDRAGVPAPARRLRGAARAARGRRARPHARRDPRLRRHRRAPARLLARLRPAPEVQAQAARALRGLRSGHLPRGHLGAAGRADPGAAARGIKVHLNLTGPVPRWATKSKKDNVTRPIPKEFQAWATAVGAPLRRPASRRGRSGTSPTSAQFLMPQYRNGQPYSPGLYRQLYQVGVRGLKKTAANRGDTYLLGETSPRGNSKIGLPARLLPAHALPGQELPQDQEVRRPRRRRLRAPRVHDRESARGSSRTTRAT